ncbi:MAG: hypothetical protein ACLQDY_03730 [Streptosporangiaceae bacterium]
MTADAALADRVGALEAKIRALFVIMEMISREAGFPEAELAASIAGRGEPPPRHLTAVPAGACVMTEAEIRHMEDAMRRGLEAERRSRLSIVRPS